MATIAEQLQTVPQTELTDEALLIRYMRAYLRTGGSAERPTCRQDMRTCVRCGTFTRFEPDADADSWSTCSACGEVA
jgi:hypothetical protein